MPVDIADDDLDEVAGGGADDGVGGIDIGLRKNPGVDDFHATGDKATGGEASACFRRLSRSPQLNQSTQSRTDLCGETLSDERPYRDLFPYDIRPADSSLRRRTVPERDTSPSPAAPQAHKRVRS